MSLKTLLCIKRSFVLGLGLVQRQHQHLWAQKRPGRTISGQMNQYLIAIFFWKKWDPRAPHQKEKWASRLLLATSPKARLWWCGVVSVLFPHLWSSIIAEKDTEILEHVLLAWPRIFQGNLYIFQPDNAKPLTAWITKTDQSVCSGDQYVPNFDVTAITLTRCGPSVVLAGRTKQTVK